MKPRPTKIKLPLTKIVEVRWRDACTKGGWREAREYIDHTPIEIVTSGYLLKHTKTEVTVVQSQSKDGDFNDAISIPADWITSMKVIRK